MENRIALKIEQVPYACAQTYHAGSGSHRQLFRPYWGPPAWQNRWVNERGKPASQNLFLPRWVQASLSSASSTLAGNRTAVLPRHARGRQIMGLVYVSP